MQTPTFDRLMGAYFHEDWDLEHDSEEEVLTDFLSANSADALAAEIQTILTEFATEESLEQYAVGRHLPSVGPDDGETFRAWLLRWQETLRA